MRKSLRMLLAGVSTGVLFATLAPSAFAQSSPPSEDAGEGTAVEEVIVTARRFEESLQDVPIPLSAFTGEELEAARVFTPESLTNQVPNLKVFRQAGSNTSYAYFIRGVGRDIGYFYAEAPVSLYIDDVFYAYQAGPVLNVGGIDHVEVLRGPQGTLYGKNSTVGTVKVYNKRPDPSGEDRSMSLTLGSYGRFEAQVSENLPLIQDKLAFRADIATKTYDGWLKDLVTNENVGGGVTHGARFGLQWEPNDRDELYISVDGTTSRDDKAPWTSVQFGPGNLTVFPRYGDRYTVASHAPNQNILDAAGITVQGTTELAGITLKSISSYRGFNQDFYNDNTSRLDMPLTWQQIITHDNTITQEFVANGTAFGDRLNYVAGVFYFDSTASMRFIRATKATEWTKQYSTSAAAYVDGSFEIIEGLRISAGVRYTHDEKDAQQAAFNAAGTKFLDVKANDSWNATTPKVGIDYQVTDNILLFATWGKGFKGGGLSTGQPTVPSQVLFVPPELATNQEIGIKSDWFENRLRVNLNYFDTDYEDQVQTILNTSTGVSSVAFADAKIKGFEFDIVFKPISRLTLSAKGALLDAKSVNVEPGFPAYTFADKTLKHAPDLAYNLGAEYELDLFGGMLTLGVDYEWVDDFYASLARNLTTMAWSYDLLNLRATYDLPDDRFQVVLDATNVLDEEYFKLGATGLSRQYGPPPEVSLTLRYRM